MARRYAQALLAIGKEKGMEELESYGATFDAFIPLLDQSSDLERLLRAPVISPAEKNAVLAKILGTLEASPIMEAFFRLLAAKARLPLLRAISEAFGRLLDDARGIVRGNVVTAVPLNKRQRDSMTSKLGKKANATLVLGFEVDPEILGGMILHLGDTVMDASLRAQLCALIDTIKRGK